MFAPTNPTSATAANPANAARHHGSGKESSEKPASSVPPSSSTHGSDQSEAWIRGTGGNGSVSQDSEPTPGSSASSSSTRENLGSGFQPTPSSSSSPSASASASASASRPKLGSGSEPTPTASSTCKHLGSDFETGENSSFNPSSEGLPGLDEATTPGGTLTENPPDTTTDDGDVVMVEGGTVEAPAEDTRPTMAELLRQHEHLRRDRAVIEAARKRVETPKPLAVDIEAIERQYAAGHDWSLIASRMEQARPYQLPRAKFDMVIETGRALAKTSVHKILASLAGPDHGNSELEELYKQFEIGQISKMPGGNLRVKVKSKEACVRLERTKVNILGGVFTFKEFDILGDKYYLDISNVDCDMDTDMILHRLFLLGCKKAAKASPVLEVTEAMINDENTALLNTLPDCLAKADKKVDGVCKLLENATNPDHITKKAVECPLAFNSALALKMAGSGHEIAELAQLHAINRVFCATQPNEDTTFSTKWKKLMGSAVPSKRSDIFKTCAKWWTSSDSIKELSRSSKALGMFELMLMSIAPTIFNNDHWIQYLTGQPVEWIPAHNTRLLHVNTLLRLLRSELGAHCMQQWSEVQWQGHLLDDLESLQKLDGFYKEDASVLQLQVVEGGVAMVAGGLATRC
ncbi:unnamed protein product [Peronospora farinosa]|uniref:BTB domain-containing protein n=1 Tax=Peronospora farinosa TaxID=134698 RepID=A0ABN8BXN7_9STRA|nr:unnamed protein product [Peronospora farinosa]